MVKLIKTLDVQNASLNVITAGRRFPLAQFAGNRDHRAPEYDICSW